MAIFNSYVNVYQRVIVNQVPLILMIYHDLPRQTLHYSQAISQVQSHPCWGRVIVKLYQI
jgi:hypothetical protein